MTVAPNCDQIWTDSTINAVHDEIYHALRQKTEVRLCLVDAWAGPVDAGMNWLVTDNHIKGAEYLTLLPEFFGHYHYHASVVHRTPTRLFNCFMNRACPFRQSWLYQFQRRGLFDHGFITYNLDYRDRDLQHLAGQPTLFEALFRKGNEIFADEHKLLSGLVPYSNVVDSLEQTIIDSKVSVVIETYFVPDDIIALSEKVFRALQLPRPLLLFSASGTLALLRDFGFDIYDDVIDQSYDRDTDPINRQIAILDQLESMEKMCYNESMQQDFQDRAKKNQDRLLQLRADWPKKFHDVLTKIEQR